MWRKHYWRRVADVKAKPSNIAQRLTFGHSFGVTGAVTWLGIDRSGMLLASDFCVPEVMEGRMTGSPKVRRWPRFVAYLPVRCTALVPGEGNQRFEGETLNVGGGGLALLLDATLPLGIPVYVEVCDEDPVRGHVVWTDQRVRRLLGTKVAHGVAFEQSVDTGRVGRWVQRAERRSHVRVGVQFDVECMCADTASHGTCLNLSQGGMFIATDDPVAPGAQVMLHFKLPSPAEPLSLPGRVVWMFRGEIEPGTVAGMGVQFLDLTPLEAAVIGSIVDRLCTDTATPVSS